MRSICVIFTILIFSVVNANACDYEFSNFGDSKEAIFAKSEVPPISFPDTFGGESVIIPINEICNDEKLKFSKLEYFFIENKLVRIDLIRILQNDRNLMDHAMQKYGKFDLPKKVQVNDWRGSYSWEKGNELITYAVFDIPDGHAENLRILNKLYFNNIADYYEKVGKWEDSQKE